MLTFPIDAKTFRKSFLDGNGSFEAAADPAMWGSLYTSDKPFQKGGEHLVRLKFSVGTSKNFRFGQRNDLALDVSVSGASEAAIELIWPGDESEVLDAYGLRALLLEGKLYVLVHLDATADGSVTGAYPVGPLSTSLGIRAGGLVGYDRLVLWDAGTSARSILDDLFAEMRLPHSAAQGEVPRHGELLALRHGGYLKLSAGLSWGYSLSVSNSIEIADLDAALDLGLKAAAAATLDYQLAGDFDISARRGSRGSDWVRFQVRKCRESRLGFAADFGFSASAELKGLPKSADDFLATLLGTNAGTFLDYFARAGEFLSVEELEGRAGALAVDFLGGLSSKWLGRALDNTSIKEFFAVAKRVVETYETIDRRIIDVYEDYLERIPELEDALEQLASLANSAAISKLPDDVLDLLRRIWGERFVDLVFGAQPLDDLKAFVAEFRDFLASSGAERIRDLIAEVKGRLGLDHLLAEVSKLDTPDKLKALVDARLQEVVGKLVGRAFSELTSSEDFKSAVGELKARLAQIEVFKTRWYESVKKLVHQKFTFDLHYAYARATEATTLLDLEISVANPAGRALAAAAARGDFARALGLYDPEVVVVNEAVLTHRLSRSAEIQINVLGHSFRSLVEVVQNQSESIEVESGGLMHVYAIDTYIKQRREKSGRDKLTESLESNFLLAAVGRSLQPTGQANTNDPVIKSLSNMAVEYDLVAQDDRTTVAELTQILAFAEHLDLVTDASAVADEIGREFPDGLGTVSARYVVRYDDRAVRNAFTLSGAGLSKFARVTARQLVGAKFTALSAKDERSRIGFAYLDPVFYEIYKNGFTDLLSTKQSFYLPSWFTGGRAKKVSLDLPQRQRLLTLFNVEQSYVAQLGALDQLVDDASAGTPVRKDDLARAAREFVSLADDLDSFGGVNTFFAIFDRLVWEGGSRKGRRQTAMILEITPSGRGTVTKYLMA